MGRKLIPGAGTGASPHYWCQPMSRRGYGEAEKAGVLEERQGAERSLGPREVSCVLPLNSLE